MQNGKKYLWKKIYMPYVEHELFHHDILLDVFAFFLMSGLTLQIYGQSLSFASLEVVLPKHPIVLLEVRCGF